MLDDCAAWGEVAGENCNGAGGGNRVFARADDLGFVARGQIVDGVAQRAAEGAGGGEVEKVGQFGQEAGDAAGGVEFAYVAAARGLEIDKDRDLFADGVEFG